MYDLAQQNPEKIIYGAPITVILYIFRLMAMNQLTVKQ
jgi:hypothetical protein